VLDVLLRLSFVGALFEAGVSPIVETSSILLATEESPDAYGSYPIPFAFVAGFRSFFENPDKEPSASGAVES